MYLNGLGPYRFLRFCTNFITGTRTSASVTLCVSKQTTNRSQSSFWSITTAALPYHRINRSVAHSCNVTWAMMPRVCERNLQVTVTKTVTFCAAVTACFLCTMQYFKMTAGQAISPASLRLCIYTLQHSYHANPHRPQQPVRLLLIISKLQQIYGPTPSSPGVPRFARLDRFAPRPVREDTFSSELKRLSRVCLRMDDACLPSEDSSVAVKSTPVLRRQRTE
jgi:hypothetical protein